MATLIDATWGGADANAFVDLTDASSFFTCHLDGATWTAANTAIGTAGQERLLIAGSASICGLRWAGAILYLDQGLAFPRAIHVARTFQGLEVQAPEAGATDLDVYEYDQQQRVRRATCEQALWLYKTTIVVSDVHALMQQAGVNSWSENYPGASHSFTYGPGSGRKTLCVEAVRLLRRYKSRGARVVRGDNLDAVYDP